MADNGTWHPKKRRATYRFPPRAGEMLPGATIAESISDNLLSQQNLAGSVGMKGAKKILFGRRRKK